MTGNSKQPIASSCGCAATDAAEGNRRAVGVDPAIKRANLSRLKRIEGQVRGLHKMVEEDRYCPDIMVQLSAVQQALRSVSRELLRNHLRHCVAQASATGGEEAERVYDELIELMHKSSR